MCLVCFVLKRDLRVCFFEVIWIRISDPRSLGSWYINETDISVTRLDLSVPLMYHDPCDLGSLILIQITPKERTLNLQEFNRPLRLLQTGITDWGSNCSCVRRTGSALAQFLDKEQTQRGIQMLNGRKAITKLIYHKSNRLKMSQNAFPPR